MTLRLQHENNTSVYIRLLKMAYNTIKQPSVDDSDNKVVKKLPLKRFDVAFHKCARVALPLHLELLKKHKCNITKFQTLSEWDKVHHEQVNASRTVQQLTADIWEIERLRNQIRDEDLEEFDKRLAPLKTETLNAIHEFLTEHKEISNPAFLLKRASIDDECEEDVSDINTWGEKQIQIDKSDSMVNQLTQSQSVMSSWKTLYNELISLNSLITGFSKAVHDQQPQIDQIQDNLDSTEDNVHQGTLHLTKAVKYKTALYPITGALIGCCAGPVGMLVGLKVGLAAAIGGGVLGFAGGKFIKSRNETVVEATEIELNNMSKEKTENNLKDSITNLYANEVMEK